MDNVALSVPRFSERDQMEVGAGYIAKSEEGHLDASPIAALATAALGTVCPVKQLSSGKGPSLEVIEAEVYKYRLIDHLAVLFLEMWWRRWSIRTLRTRLSSTSKITKRTGNSGKHRDISIFNISKKIFVYLLLNRFNGNLGRGLMLESQCSFRRRQETTDTILAAGQL
ncbi:hypothetical protein SprV_0602069900 [Sparganum proliferum]